MYTPNKPSNLSRKRFLTILGLIILSTVSLLFFTKTFRTQAGDLNTYLTVGNAAPAFTAGPAENPISSSTSPTTEGSNVTFTATATDGNGENYYFIVCSTNAVTAGTAGGAPTCGGTTYCTSTSTTSGNAASCSYTTKSTDASSNDWYAFVCDVASSSSCSTASQGSGTDGSESPFYVNHAPTFTSATNGGAVNPGSNTTWTTVASDSDGNTIKLVVCATAGITASGTCTGTTLCSSSLTASNPTCSYSVPNPTPDDTYNAYVYIVDQFNQPSTSAAQGTNVSYTVNNVAPVVSAVTLNGGSDITLTAGLTTAVTVTATVTDNNGCSGTEISSVAANVYRSGITNAGCTTANGNNCYPNISCTQVAGSCSGLTDASADYTCSVDIKYYADPTVADTKFPTETWLTTVKATDDDLSSGSAELASGVEMNALAAIALGTQIDYGSPTLGTPLDPAIETAVTSTGNVGLDVEISGTNMCTDYSTCSTVGLTPVTVDKQKYTLTSGTLYNAATTLTTSPVQEEINITKVISDAGSSKSIWWGILVPTGTQAGSYTGKNTITGVASETAEW